MNESSTHRDDTESISSLSRPAAGWRTPSSRANPNSSSHRSRRNDSPALYDTLDLDFRSPSVILQNLHQRHSYQHQNSTHENPVHENGIAEGNRVPDEYVSQSKASASNNRRHTDVASPPNGRADNASEDSSIRSETTVIQRRDLGTIDVAALIINKQIGTGIFATPGLVLSLTGSKTDSIVIWFCGGIWAFLR